MSTFVLVHGGWAGGWQFKQLEAHLRQKGHQVYRPTLTGLGERVHLASPHLELMTHVMDVVNLFMYEELEDVRLLGYSYGGMVITGVAEQVAQRISHLIYLDAYVPSNGESLADLVGDEVMGWMEGAASEYGDGWRIPHNPPGAHLRTDQPLKPVKQKLDIRNPDAQNLARAFIHCTENHDALGPILTPIIAKASSAKTDPNWQYFELEASHGDVWETHSSELADILHQHFAA